MISMYKDFEIDKVIILTDRNPANNINYKLGGRE